MTRFSWFALACLSVVGVMTLRAEGLTLTVSLKGFKSDKGMAEVALFQDAAAFPTKPARALAKLRTPVSGLRATVEFKNLAPGTYAVSAYHDQNGNGKMDTNFIGIPREPVGVSNDAKGRMGPPSFKDAQFELTADKSITITIQ